MLKSFFLNLGVREPASIRIQPETNSNLKDVQSDQPIEKKLGLVQP